MSSMEKYFKDLDKAKKKQKKLEEDEYNSGLLFESTKEYGIVVSIVRNRRFLYFCFSVSRHSK